MDVDANSFPRRLLGMLVDISEADFVSIDLEMTGIPSRLPDKDRPKPRSGKGSLEDRYEETKIAAERYHILQIGLTCAHFDIQTDRYVLRPYNVIISPLLNEKLDIEREIHIQSGAATFLLNHGFDWGAPFARGVQYLSRAEALLAMQLVDIRLDKSRDVVEDMQLKEKDVQSLDFVRRAREAIKAWKKNKNHMLEITTHTGLKDEPREPTVSRFEKRLVHQLVRAEFPELVTIGRQDCIRVIHYDREREEENKRRIKKRVKEQIVRQTGFRWIFEALADGDLHEVDPYHFGPSDGIIAGGDPNNKIQFDLAQQRLIKNRPVLVGHNMFTDLVYFYHSFVGELPSTLDEFRSSLHELFPRIVDTKYLATHAEGDLNASPTLQDIAEKIESQPLPNIVTHGSFLKYHETTAFHEAGYDSLLTATILLRLSAKMDADLQQQRQNSQSDGSFKTTSEKQHSSNGSHSSAALLPPVVDLNSVPRSRKGKINTDNPATPMPARFHTSNIFDSLRELDLDGGNKQEASFDTTQKPPTGEEEAKNVDWEEVVTPDTTDWATLNRERRKPMELIPAWNSTFWDTFGNTLRVYGTQEAVLKIAEWNS